MKQTHSGFKKQAVRHVFNHLMLSTALILHFRPIIGAINKKYHKRLIHSFDLKYQPEKLSDYAQQADKALIWHGTGRYERNNQGETVDIFSQILEVGELRPGLDIYDMFNGEMKSISTTPSRIIARCYADIHDTNIKHAPRYGTAFFWVTYFYSKIYAEVFAAHGIKFIREYPKWIKLASDKGNVSTIKWGKKVHADAALWNTFKLGSDISGNYPILMGIKQYNDALRTSKFMARAEIRLGSGVKLADISHIEVPEEKIKETEKILFLHHAEIKVYPIEFGEYIASTQPFSKLLYPNIN